MYQKLLFINGSIWFGITTQLTQIKMNLVDGVALHMMQLKACHITYLLRKERKLSAQRFTNLLG